VALSYEELHWGESPRAFSRGFALASVRVSPCGEVKAVSYASNKGGRPEIHRHPFDRRRDRHERRSRHPHLLELAPREGEFRLGKIDPDVNAVGLAIDLELANGERVYLADGWVVTGPEGSYVQLAFSQSGVPFNLEQLGQFVSERGLEG